MYNYFKRFLPNFVPHLNKDKMKALVLHEINTPFTVREIPEPVAQKGEVLVKIIASGINPLDLKIKAGQAAHAGVKLPGAVLGIDMSGVVAAVGADVSRFKPGDAVFGMVGAIGGKQGTLAEYIAVDADLLALKPKHISFSQAAALPLISITAWEALVEKANIQAGTKVLIHGGAGGVGHIAIQIAVSKGAEVYTTVKTDEIPLVEHLGAIAIDRSEYGVADFMSRYPDFDGFDVILDTIGGEVLDASFQLVKRYTGHVVSILGWGTHSLAPLSFRGGTYSGVFTLYPLLSGKNHLHHGNILGEVARLAEAGKLLPIMDERILPFEAADEAYRIIKNGEAKGKMVLSVSAEA